MKRKLLALTVILTMVLGSTVFVYADPDGGGPRPGPRSACIQCCLTPPPCDYYYGEDE